MRTALRIIAASILALIAPLANAALVSFENLAIPEWDYIAELDIDNVEGPANLSGVSGPRLGGWSLAEFVNPPYEFSTGFVAGRLRTQVAAPGPTVIVRDPDPALLDFSARYILNTVMFVELQAQEPDVTLGFFWNLDFYIFPTDDSPPSGLCTVEGLPPQQECADYIVASNFPFIPPMEFAVEGITYFIRLNMGVETLPEEACLAAPFDPGCAGVVVEPGSSASIPISVVVTTDPSNLPSPVSLPSSGILAVLAMTMMSIARRSVVGTRKLD